MWTKSQLQFMVELCIHFCDGTCSPSNIEWVLTTNALLDDLEAMQPAFIISITINHSLVNAQRMVR